MGSWHLIQLSSFFKQQLTAPIESLDKPALQHKGKHGIWTPTQGKWHVFTDRLHHLRLHLKRNGVHIHWCPPSVSLKRSRLSILTPSRTSESQKQTSLLAAHLVFLPLPIYSTGFSLIVSLSGSPSPLSYCIPKNKSQPPEGFFDEKGKKIKNQGGDSRGDTLKLTAASFPTYRLKPIWYRLYTDLYLISNIPKFFQNEH